MLVKSLQEHRSEVYKNFQYEDGNKAAATEKKELPYSVRRPANEVHIVPGIKNTLISTNKFTDANYAWIFDQDEVNVYDLTNTAITVSREAVLKGWKVPGEGLWRIPLARKHPTSEATHIITVRDSPTKILQSQPPPLPDTIANVYELKTKPELIRYYHAAAGFPTKPTWLAAIRNNQYASWPGLDPAAVARYFPESEEM